MPSSSNPATPQEPQSPESGDRCPPPREASSATNPASQRFSTLDIEQATTVARQSFLCLVEDLNEEKVAHLRRFLAAQDHLNAHRMHCIRTAVNEAAGDVSLSNFSDTMLRASGRTVFGGGR